MKSTPHPIKEHILQVKNANVIMLLCYYVIMLLANAYKQQTYKNHPCYCVTVLLCYCVTASVRFHHHVYTFCPTCIYVYVQENKKDGEVLLLFTHGKMDSEGFFCHFDIKKFKTLGCSGGFVYLCTAVAFQEVAAERI